MFFLPDVYRVQEGGAYSVCTACLAWYVATLAVGSSATVSMAFPSLSIRWNDAVGSSSISSGGMRSSKTRQMSR